MGPIDFTSGQKAKVRAKAAKLKSNKTLEKIIPSIETSVDFFQFPI